MTTFLINLPSPSSGLESTDLCTRRQNPKYHHPHSCENTSNLKPSRPSITMGIQDHCKDGLMRSGTVNVRHFEFSIKPERTTANKSRRKCRTGTSSLLQFGHSSFFAWKNVRSSSHTHTHVPRNNVWEVIWEIQKTVGWVRQYNKRF